MLRLTTRAAEMIQNLTHEADLPHGGLRIAQAGEHPGLVMQLAPAPRAEDDVLHEAGVVLFLDPVAVSRLQSQVLDARSGDDGAAFYLAR